MLSLTLTLAALLTSHAESLSSPRSEGRIEGRVFDTHHEPVADVRVILGEIGHSLLIYNTPAEMFVTTPGVFDPESKRYKAELTTGREGRFVAIGLSMGEFSVIAGDKERGIAITSARVDAGGAATLEITLAAPGYLAADITGLAFDSQRNTLELSPISQGSNIQLVPRLEQRPGQWSFRSAPLPAIKGWRLIGCDVVPIQDYRATLFAIPISIAAGEDQHLVRDLSHGNDVAGTVLDAHGEPLSGVSIVAREPGDNPAACGAVTDLQGHYRIRGLSTGPYTLEAARWKMRELVGCGNGSQDVRAAKEIVLPLAQPTDADFRVEALIGAPVVGDPALTFRTVKLDGGKLDLASMRGKIVLLDFWATWCGLCRMEMPNLLETYKLCAHEGRFEIIGVSIDSDVALVPRFVASRAFTWPQTALGPAATNPIARLYNVSSTPSTVLIGQDGRIAALNLTGEALRKKIEELLQAK